MKFRLSLAEDHDDKEGLPCTYVVSERNNNATDRRGFGTCFAFSEKETETICEELMDFRKSISSSHIVSVSFSLNAKQVPNPLRSVALLFLSDTTYVHGSPSLSS